MPVLRVIPVGDLALKKGSPYYIEGIAYIRQKLSVRFRFFLGEWFLNQLEGVPYYRDVFVHDPDLDVITSLFKRIVTTCPGITGLQSFRMFYDEANRTASFAFVALVDGGVIVVTAQDKDFIVDANKLARVG